MGDALRNPVFTFAGIRNETYVKVKGRWTYVYRAVDKDGDTIDFYLSPTRNAKALSASWARR